MKTMRFVMSTMKTQLACFAFGVFLVSQALLVPCHAQEGIEATPYDHYTTKTDNAGGRELSLYDSGNRNVASLSFNNTSTKIKIKTADGEEGTVESADEISGTHKVHTETTSSGLNYKIRLTYSAPYTLERPAHVVAIDLWQANQWRPVTSPDLAEITEAEKAIFNTDALKLMYATIRTLVQPAMPSFRPMGGTLNEPVKNGVPRVLRVQACTAPCRCSCVRITMISPLYVCVDNTVPDLCPCAACKGTWDLSCCCTNAYHVCLVPCAAFLAFLEPPDFNGVVGFFQSTRDRMGNGSFMRSQASDGFINSSSSLLSLGALN